MKMGGTGNFRKKRRKGIGNLGSRREEQGILREK